MLHHGEILTAYVPAAVQAQVAEANEQALAAARRAALEAVAAHEQALAGV